ncbi:DUF4013 domain-containing protein [Halorubrum gandharaense]
MIVDAFKYPLTDDGYARTLLIGSILTVGSILILPVFVLLGFFTKTIGNAIDGNAPPQFEEYGSLFVDGVKLSAVLFVYLLVFVMMMGLFSLMASISETAGTIGFLLLVLFYFGLMYVATSILFHFSRRRRMADAFDLRAVLSTAFSLRYLLVVLLWLFVIPTLFAIGQVLLAVTIVGILLIPATLVYELIIYAKLIGDLEGPARTSGDGAETGTRSFSG